MAVSITSTKSGFDQATAVGEQAVRLKVTGVDTGGHMFRHAATVLMVDGRNCEFRSESQPEQDGSLLAEFDYPQADPQRRITQARVKSVQADADGKSYRVVVELEHPQSASVAPPKAEPPIPIKKPAPQPAPAPAAAPAPRAPESRAVPAVAPAEPVVVPRMLNVSQPQPVAARPVSVESPVAKVEGREAPPKPQAADLLAMRETVKSAVATEIKQEMEALQKRLSTDLERNLASIVSANMDKMIRDGVGKLFASNYNASMQALKAEVTSKLLEGLTTGNEARSAIEKMAKQHFETQTELARTAGAQAEQALNVRANERIAALEKTIAEMEAKTAVARGEMESALARSQAMQQEISASLGSLQEAVQRIDDAESSGEVKFQDQAAAQMSSFAEQFENMLNKICIERATLFSADVGTQLAPHQKQADEIMDKLGGAFQLMRSTVKVQQERLTEHARATAANFEKEIREALLRLAGGAETGRRSDENL